MFSYIRGIIGAIDPETGTYSVYPIDTGFGFQIKTYDRDLIAAPDRIREVNVYTWPFHSESAGTVLFGFSTAGARRDAEKIYNVCDSGVGPSKISKAVQLVGSAEAISHLTPVLLGKQVAGLGTKGSEKVIAAARKVSGFSSTSIQPAVVAALRLIGVEVVDSKLQAALKGKTDVESAVAAYLALLR